MSNSCGDPIRKDFELLDEICAGKKEAFSGLVDKYQGRVRGYCLNVLGNRELAEDAAQEIFIKVYRGLPGFSAKASFSTWLYRITVNHCRDILRKKIRQKTESWDELLEKEGEVMEAALSAESRVKNDLDRDECLERILCALTEKARDILVLREIQGLSYQEISEVLGCSLDGVKARLRRARGEMAQKIGHLSKEACV
jgi:RNA polymerase sigma-70 factor (ECF subfamily)